MTRYYIYRETLIDFREHLWTFIGAFVGIMIIALIQSYWVTKWENVFLIGSFGASCVLLYGAAESPLAQPRNLIGGHVISALIGVTIYKILPEILWLTAPLSVSLSIVAMQITKTLHPPGGATALIAIIGTEKIKALGYMYVVAPVLTGCIILLIVALICNNATPHRKYPAKSRLIKRIERNRARRRKRIAV